MRRVTIIGLCLVVAFPLSTVMVASSSATAPEFGSCIKQTGGKFSEAGCRKTSTEEKTKKYEWYPGFSGARPIEKPKFTLAAKENTLTTLEEVKGTKYTCTGVTTGTGEYTGEKTVGGVVLKLTGCMGPGIGCENAASEEIVTKVLEGELGIEKVGTKPPENNRLGVVLFGPGHGAVMAFTCGGAPVVVTGSVVLPVTTNKMEINTTAKFTARKGEQTPDKFAGEGVDAHTLYSCLAGCGGEPEEAGLTVTWIQTNEEKIEASSVN